MFRTSTAVVPSGVEMFGPIRSSTGKDTLVIYEVPVALNTCFTIAECTVPGTVVWDAPQDPNLSIEFEVGDVKFPAPYVFGKDGDWVSKGYTDFEAFRQVSWRQPCNMLLPPPPEAAPCGRQWWWDRLYDRLFPKHDEEEAVIALPDGSASVHHQIMFVDGDYAVKSWTETHVVLNKSKEAHKVRLVPWVAAACVRHPVSE